MQQGFVEKLVQRIVDNIEINVADIHIRYRWVFPHVPTPSFALLRDALKFDELLSAFTMRRILVSSTRCGAKTSQTKSPSPNTNGNVEGSISFLSWRRLLFPVRP